MTPANLKQSLEVGGTHNPVPVVQPELAASVSGDTATPEASLQIAPMHTPHTWSDVAWRTMDGGAAAFGFLWKLFKLFICIGLDLLDMVMVGWIGVSMLFEVGSALICMALWGKRGLWGSSHERF